MPANVSLPSDSHKQQPLVERLRSRQTEYQIVNGEHDENPAETVNSDTKDSENRHGLGDTW